MCVNIFLKQRCIMFSIGECNVGGNSTIKSRVLIDRAGSGFVQGSCGKWQHVLGELDQRGAESPEINALLLSQAWFVLPCLLQLLYPVVNCSCPAGSGVRGSQGCCEQGLQPNLELLGLSLSALEPQTGLCYLCRSSVGCKTRSCGVCFVWVFFVLFFFFFLKRVLPGVP